MKFKYFRFGTQPTPTVPVGYFHRPMIPIRVIGPVADWAMYAIVDTAADETTFPKSVGDRIGVAIDDAALVPVSGIGGYAVNAFLGNLEIELKQGNKLIRWPQLVRFVPYRRPEDEIAILGHAGFLNYFTATFNGKKRELTLRPNRTFPKA